MRIALTVVLGITLAGCTAHAEPTPLPPAIKYLRAWTLAQERLLNEEAARRPHNDVIREAILELESLQLAACSLSPRQPRCVRICQRASAIRYGWCDFVSR